MEQFTIAINLLQVYGKPTRDKWKYYNIRLSRTRGKFYFAEMAVSTRKIPGNLIATMNCTLSNHRLSCCCWNNHYKTQWELSTWDVIIDIFSYIFRPNSNIYIFEENSDPLSSDPQPAYESNHESNGIRIGYNFFTDLDQLRDGCSFQLLL